MDPNGVADGTNGSRYLHIFVVGLRNAHAMEIQARELMERQSERLDEYPEVKAKVATHLQDEQLKRLEQCLETCGESTSTVQGHHAVPCGQRHGHGALDGGRRDLEEYLCEQCVRTFRNRGLQVAVDAVPGGGDGRCARAARSFLEGGGADGGWIDANVATVMMEYVAHEQAA